MAAKTTTIDEYLAAVSAAQRAALEKLRKAIRAAAPKAEECISYQLAAFRLNGKPLVAFGATANHCAFYPMSSAMVDAHKDELKAYDTSKGTIRFPADKPLPAALVKKLVKARIAENEGRRGKAKGPPKPARKRVAEPAPDGPQTDPAVVTFLRELDHPLETGDRGGPADHPRRQPGDPRRDQVERAELPDDGLFRDAQPTSGARLAHPAHRSEGEGQRDEGRPGRRPDGPAQVAREGSRPRDVRRREGGPGQAVGAGGYPARVDQAT